VMQSIAVIQVIQRVFPHTKRNSATARKCAKRLRRVSMK
jgi:hypothetical protein